MKKTFQFNVKNKTTDRQIDSIKSEVKKYFGRERRKKLPESVDYWDFECKIGNNEKVADSVHMSKINEMINKIAATKTESFYLEILAIPAQRMKK
ncbi:MAG: hypothetical protein HN576_11475 [Bacteriovoracaceae bacterium]|jgi:hypothetical protein|nr:hypothetical protein [Bacteriovoracaceae bacterium]